MAEDDARTAWVKRVLGVEIAGPVVADASSSGAVDVPAIWRAAKEATDEKMNALAGKLRQTGDVDLIRIADYGLFGISGGGGINVALNKALFEYGAASGERRSGAAQQVRKAVQTYRAAIAGNEAVKLVDNNPFGVDVALAATLGSAFDQIERSLA